MEVNESKDNKDPWVECTQCGCAFKDFEGMPCPLCIRLTDLEEQLKEEKAEKVKIVNGVLEVAKKLALSSHVTFARYLEKLVGYSWMDAGKVEVKDECQGCKDLQRQLVKKDKRIDDLRQTVVVQDYKLTEAKAEKVCKRRFFQPPKGVGWWINCENSLEDGEHCDACGRKVVWIKKEVEDE